MSEDAKLILSTAFLTFVLSLILIMGVMTISGTAPSQMRQKAVKHGAAEYFLNEDHQREFRWLDEKQEGLDE